MKSWKCPNCKKERYYITELIMKVCEGCQVEMEVVGDVKGRT